MRPFTKVHYYAFLLDALARFPHEGLQVGLPSLLRSIVGRRRGRKFKHQFLDAVIGRMKTDDCLNDGKAGLYAEFGVFKGVSISRIASLFPDQTIYGFDSFEGFPSDGRTDWNSDFSVKTVPAVPGNVKLFEGFFEDTLPIFKGQVDGQATLKLAHIDCDLYSSTRTVFTELDGFFAPGSVIIFDELLNYRRFAENEFLAFYEFLMRRNLDFVWYAKRGNTVDFHNYCHGKHSYPMREHRQKGFYQYAAIQLTQDNNLSQRLETFEKQATELAKVRKAAQKLSPIYAKRSKGTKAA